MDYIRPENISFNFIRGGITLSDTDDGLINYVYEPASEGPVLSDSMTVNGRRAIIDKLDKGGTLTLVIQKDTPLHKKALQAEKIRGSMTGFLSDESESESTTTYTQLSGAIQKSSRDLSTTETEFKVIGNFDVTTL